MCLQNIPCQQLQASRNAYNYPAVALDGALGAFTVIQFPTTSQLDAYLNGLLTSHNNNDKVLGYLGVLFWGHYSGQDGRIGQARALGKVNLAYVGKNRVVKGQTQRMRGVLDITVNVAANYIDQAIANIANNQYGNALSNLGNLAQLQIAFASKVCAFIDPTKCGVIDSVIAANYPQFGFVVNNGGYVTNTVGNRNLYDAYCLCLQQTAARLNADQNYSTWTDRDGTAHPWRALDVERALY